ncbi:MAG: SIS domain-containing protein [Candidatus Omnitrophica bacterium]|nr:SIS domain-containing protein [Candidatus Omnitrophota bacterium]
MKNEIVKEILPVLESIDYKYNEQLSGLLKKAKRVFVAGAGRSGLIGRSFAMRLSHLGIESYAAGETICPPVKKGDLLVFISCAGDKKTLFELAKISKKSGSKVLCITSAPDNPLAKLSDYRIIVPVKKSVQFGNSLFEQAVFVFLEGFVEYYRRKEKISLKEMSKRHANLE